MSDASIEFDEALRASLRAGSRTIGTLCAEECPLQAFYDSWSRIVVASTGANGISLWELRDGDARLVLSAGAHRLAEDADSKAAISEIRKKTFARTKPLWYRASVPRNGHRASRLVYEVLVVRNQWRGTSSYTVELVFDGRQCPWRRRSIRRFLSPALDRLLAHQSQLQNNALNRQVSKLSEALEYSQALHAEMTVRDVAYVAVNESRRLLDVDRVTLFVRRKNRFEPIAVSAQDSFDSRSPTLKSLATISMIAAHIAEPVFDDDDKEHHGVDFKALTDHHFEIAHTRRLAAVPLSHSSVDDSLTSCGSDKHILGVVVYERLTSSESLTLCRDELQQLGHHTSQALHRTWQYEQDASSLKRRFRHTLSRLEQVPLIKAMGALFLLGATMIVAFVIPFDFTVSADATLQPTICRDVFAPSNAVIDHVFVRHGDVVKPGDLLIRLRSPDIAIAITEAYGTRSALEQQLATVELALFGDGTPMKSADQIALAGRREELRVQIASLTEKLSILERRQEALEIKSPISGYVLTWEVERTLENRPVLQGQRLLTVADTSGPWHLEAHVEDGDIGHVSLAHANSRAPLKVTYVRLSIPTRSFSGHVTEIQNTATASLEGGSAVSVQIAISPTDCLNLTPGSEVVAKIHCGRRSLAYVCLHDAVEFIQTKLLFRLM